MTTISPAPLPDAPIPDEVQKILDGAINKIEAAKLLSVYRRLGLHAVIKTGLWLNKNRSPEGMAAWRAFIGPINRKKNQRKATNKRARRAKAESILQQAIESARQP